MRKLFERAGGFSGDESGAMFTFAAVFLIGMLGFGGLAVDVGTWYVTQRAMSLAADAAALAAAHQMSDSNSSDGDVEAAALIGANKNGFSIANGDDIDVNILPDNGGIQVAISRPARLFFSSLFVSDTPVVTSAATAALRAGSMELALILDVSGSMNKPEKIGAARTAAQDLIDILYDSEETLPDTWVAVIPFSGRVNIRDYGEAWMENADTGDADHLCVGLRSVAHMTNDAPHTAEIFPDYIEPKKKTTCPDAKALGLTAEKTTVKNHIAALTTTHGTSTHRGMVWGWRALSPSSFAGEVRPIRSLA